MAAGTDVTTSLITLAAEAIAPAVAGCANVLAAGSRDAASEDSGTSLRIKAINYFGPRITDRWVSEWSGGSPSDAMQALAGLAAVPFAIGRADASATLARLVPGAADRDQALAVEYLAAIPLSVRRALIPDPTTGKLALATPLPADTRRTVLRLLPPEVPPFPIGAAVPGTSYQLDELLGIGGFGAVYKARNRCEQNQPPRAIKFCLDPSMIESLHREREILDRMMSVDGAAWSNRIVRLYGYALESRPPFLVYEYVSGGDLTSYLASAQQKAGRGFPPHVVLELVRQVAEALAFAHGQGLVHRDLKPANILVSRSTIKLTDFGIGGAVTQSAVDNFTGTSISHATAADQISLFRGSGTPLYMSAEQRRGDRPDPRHDLFSLGVVWYQLMVGDVTRELHPGWPDELVEEFQAPPEHIELIQRCVGYFKKRPANAGELLKLFPSPSTAKRATSIVAPTTRSNKVSALKASLADQLEREAWKEARQAVKTLLQISPEDPEALAAEEFLSERESAVRCDDKNVCTKHQGWVRCVVISPDARHIFSGGDDGSIHVFDRSIKSHVHCLKGHHGAVMSVAISANGRRVLSGGWDGTIRLWDAETGQPLRVLEGDGQGIKSVALRHDATTAVFAGASRTIRVWDLMSGRLIHRLEGHSDTVQSIALSPDGRHLLSGADDCHIRMWDLETGAEIRQLVGHEDAITSVGIGPNGCWAASGGTDRTVRIWDLKSGRELKRITGHRAWVNAVAIGADSRHVLTASGGEMRGDHFCDGDDMSVRLWDVVTGAEVCRFDGHSASVTGAALALHQQLAVSCSADGTVRVWELPLHVNGGVAGEKGATRREATPR